MQKVSATEFSKHFGFYRDMVQREPVAVTNHDRVTGVFISDIEYEEYQRLKLKSQKSFAVKELSEETIRAIANTTMDARHNHLNKLLDD